MTTGTCVECGATFGYRRRGRDQVTCSERCGDVRRSRQAAVRRERALQRAVAAEIAARGL
ncbi:MAG: hypothetical protein KF809_14845 [Chloroflexi bacterium]|nr:hypothetical protein [Chloroflexota bacterium]